MMLHAAGVDFFRWRRYLTRIMSGLDSTRHYRGIGETRAYTPIGVAYLREPAALSDVPTDGE